MSALPGEARAGHCKRLPSSLTKNLYPVGKHGNFMVGGQGGLHPLAKGRVQCPPAETGDPTKSGILWGGLLHHWVQGTWRTGK